MNNPRSSIYGSQGEGSPCIYADDKKLTNEGLIKEHTEYRNIHLFLSCDRLSLVVIGYISYTVCNFLCTLYIFRRF